MWHRHFHSHRFPYTSSSRIFEIKKNEINSSTHQIHQNDRYWIGQRIRALFRIDQEHEDKNRAKHKRLKKTVQLISFDKHCLQLNLHGIPKVSGLSSSTRTVSTMSLCDFTYCLLFMSSVFSVQSSNLELELSVLASILK